MALWRARPLFTRTLPGPVSQSQHPLLCHLHLPPAIVVELRKFELREFRKGVSHPRAAENTTNKQRAMHSSYFFGITT